MRTAPGTANIVPKINTLEKEPISEDGELMPSPMKPVKTPKVIRTAQPQVTDPIVGLAIGGGFAPGSPGLYCCVCLLGLSGNNAIMTNPSHEQKNPIMMPSTRRPFSRPISIENVRPVRKKIELSTSSLILVFAPL